MLNIVFTCSLNRMCNSYYWCSTCAMSEFPFPRKEFGSYHVGTHTHSQPMHCDVVKKAKIFVATAWVLLVLTTVLTIITRIPIPAVAKFGATGNASLFFHYHFYAHFQICALLFTIYMGIIHRILKFMHELLSVCSLPFTSAFYSFLDELCSSHRSESIRFDSIRFVSIQFHSIQFEFIFKFVILFSVELNKNYGNSSSSNISKFCLSSSNERKHVTAYSNTANGIIYSFTALCKMNLKICQTATGSGCTHHKQNTSVAEHIFHALT